jgi:hypothetical protein
MSDTEPVEEQEAELISNEGADQTLPFGNAPGEVKSPDWTPEQEQPA